MGGGGLLVGKEPIGPFFTVLFTMMIVSYESYYVHTFTEGIVVQYYESAFFETKSQMNCSFDDTFGIFPSIGNFIASVAALLAATLLAALKLFPSQKLPAQISEINSSNARTALFQLPPFKIPSFMFVLRVITAKCVMLRCKV